MWCSPMAIYFKLARLPSSAGISPVRVLPPMNMFVKWCQCTDETQWVTLTHRNTILCINMVYYICNDKLSPIAIYSRLVMCPRVDGIGPSNWLFPINEQETVTWYDVSSTKSIYNCNIDIVK